MATLWLLGTWKVVVISPSLYVDPHPKASYLFALVAGLLVARSDTFTTMSGKHVDLKALTLIRTFIVSHLTLIRTFIVSQFES